MVFSLRDAWEANQSVDKLSIELKANNGLVTVKFKDAEEKKEVAKEKPFYMKTLPPGQILPLYWSARLRLLGW